MTSRISREPLIAAAALAAAFVALTVWVKFHGTIPGDRRTWRLANEHIPTRPNVSDFYGFMGGLGSPLTAMLTTLTAAAIVLRNVDAYSAGLMVAAALVALLEPPIADAVGQTDAAAQIGIIGGGYPSGHVLFVTSTYGMAAVLALRHRRPEIATVAVVVIVLMGVVRVTQRAHLLDEVLAGYLLGATWLCVLLSTSTGPRLRPKPRRT